ncbi:MAG: hypothetical protein DMG79_11765 [Acidobacteria bacterium]|nr:MAG: hypothetical protein DMG79_11765 [Acidobacteriota bacterium]
MRGAGVRGVAEFVILQKFDDHAAKGLVGEISHEVRVGRRQEIGLAVDEFHVERSLAFDLIGDVRRSQHHVNIIVAMPVHHGVGVRRDLDVEDADLTVREDLVMVGFGGDLDLGSRLGREERGQEQEEEDTSHERGL